MSDEQDYEMGNGDEVQYSETNGGGANGTDEKPAKDDERKLFVGGLSWETTEKELREYFAKFGEIDSVNIKTDPNTGRSRGFSFIVFKNSDALQKVFEIPEHTINNKKVDPKRAKLRSGKIFVGGITSDMSDDDIKGHFAKYGTITLTEMPFDKVKNQRKGFCFITYESDQMINEVIKNPKQTICGKQVDVKKATPKPNEQLMMNVGAVRGRGAVRGARGVRGGARGAYPVTGYAPNDYLNPYGYGYDYYGYGSSYGYDYYGSDPYAYGYDYSGYTYDPTGYATMVTSTTPTNGTRGRGGAPVNAGKQTRGATSRGYRHAPY